MKRFHILVLLVLMTSCILMQPGCKDSGTINHSPTNPLEDGGSAWDSLIALVNRSADRNRYVWQKPDLVLDYLGNIEGKTVADIGAGSGYFTLLIPQRGAKVIAIDIDTNALKGINETMHLPYYQPELRDNIELRLVLEDDPQLETEEVDAVMIINTFTYIDDRTEYLQKVIAGMKPGGKLLIVDFKPRRIPLNIPRNLRLPLYQVEDDLYNAGFVNILADDCSLAYQYVITAEKARTER